MYRRVSVSPQLGATRQGCQRNSKTSPASHRTSGGCCPMGRTGVTRTRFFTSGQGIANQPPHRTGFHPTRECDEPLPSRLLGKSDEIEQVYVQPLGEERQCPNGRDDETFFNSAEMALRLQPAFVSQFFLGDLQLLSKAADSTADLEGEWIALFSARHGLTVCSSGMRLVHLR